MIKAQRILLEYIAKIYIVKGIVDRNRKIVL